MKAPSKYVSRTPDEKGHIEWSDEENAIWHDLITRQLGFIQDKACDEYLKGLELIDLPTDRIPQLEEINSVLRRETGWEVSPVPALIGFGKFFSLLADKKFPIATFIRNRDEFDYLQEPDIFHEIFGHCAMLTNSDFSEFTHIYGKLGKEASKKDRVWLARLYWFTVEFGLIQSDQGLRIYGGGILSSPKETEFALNSDKPERKPFEPIEVLRTAYRIDKIQPKYFVINDIHDLYELAQMDIMGLIEQAKALGLHPIKEIEA